MIGSRHTDLLPRLVADRADRDRWTVGELLEQLGWPDPLGLRHGHAFPVDALYQSNERTQEALQKALVEVLSGYISLIGPPGVGKSTLLAAGLLPTPRAIVIRYLAFVPHEGHGLGRGEAFDLLHDIITQLKQQKLGAQIMPGTELTELREQFETLLAEARQRFHTEQIKTLIVVDGLDHVPREEKTEHSFLRELPLPHAVPEGVIFILGTQRLDLDGIPPAVRDEAGRNDRCIQVSPLSREAVTRLADAAGVPDDVDRADLYDRTQGHPLSTRYIIEGLRGAPTPESRQNWLRDGPAYGGNVDTFYQRAWHDLERNTEARRALAYVALAEGPIRPVSLDKLVGSGATDAAWDAAGHLMVRNQQNAWSIFHNSFRIFLCDRTALRHGVSDDNSVRQRYRLNLKVEGENARRAVFDAFVSDLAHGREYADLLLPVLCDILELVSPQPSWPLVWAQLREHLSQFHEYRIGHDLEPTSDTPEADEIIRDATIPWLPEMMDSDDYAVRRTAISLSRFWGQQFVLKRSRLPAIYDLKLSPNPQANKFEPPSGISSTSPGLWTEDLFAWTWPLEAPLKLTSKASQQNLYNIRARVAHFMRRMGGTSGFGPEAVKRQQDRFHNLHLYSSYRKLMVIAAFQAMREVVGELEAAEAIDPDSLPFILHKAAAFDPKINTMPPLPRPVGVPRIVASGLFNSNRTDLWRGAAKEDAVVPTVAGSVVLASTAVHERPHFRKKWIVEQYSGPDFGIAAQGLLSQLQRLPRAVIFGGVRPLYKDLGVGAVVHPHPDFVGSVVPYVVLLCPRVAAAVHWRADPRDLFSYRDAAGRVVARTLFWRDGGVQSGNTDSTFLGRGCLLIVAEDCIDILLPFLSSEQIAIAWRVTDEVDQDDKRLVASGSRKIKVLA